MKLSHLATFHFAFATTWSSAHALIAPFGSPGGRELLRRQLPANCALPIDTVNNRCGNRSQARCDVGFCCSLQGACGTTDLFCGSSCQSAFGTCTDKESLVCEDPTTTSTTSTRTGRGVATYSTSTSTSVAPASTTSSLSTTSSTLSTSSLPLSTTSTTTLAPTTQSSTFLATSTSTTSLSTTTSVASTSIASTSSSTTLPPTSSSTSLTSTQASTTASGGAYCSLPVDTGGACGGPAGTRCATGCCSAYGYCGTSDAYCGTGCQTGFGSCAGAPAPSCNGATATTSVVPTTSTFVTSTTSPTALGTSTVPSGTAVPVATGASGPKFAIYSNLWLANGSPPAASSLAGFNTFILSFHLMTGAADMALGWEWLTNTQRAAVRTDYKNAGIKLLVAAFGATDTPTTDGYNPIFAANWLADWTIKYGLDGVDIDYEDFAAMNSGKAEAWLIAYTRQLRARLPSPYIITHAPVAPWFTDQPGAYPGGGYLAVNAAVGQFINYYNLQFYNQGANEYIDCTTLLTRSTVYQHSSLFEIAANGVPLNKLVIGKPAIPSDADNGYMAPSLLRTCVAQAKAKGWSGGLMLWQHPHQPADFASTVWN